MVSVNCIVDAGDSLGESPLWDPNEKVLYWVDINRCLIHRLDPAAGETKDWSCPTEPGCIGRADSGRLIAGLRNGFHYFHPTNGAFEPIIDPEPDKPSNRLNDGKIDRAGRLWAGTMQDPNPDEPNGALHRLEDMTATQMIGNLRIPNALCWSPDNATMYFADTRARAIWRFDFELETGSISNQRTFVDLSDQPGRPDGATVDSEGGVWIAKYGGHRVVRYTPDGDVDTVIDLPVANATCPAFGGADLKTLYITTASQRLTEEDLKKQPLAGGLFACDLGVAGLHEPMFGKGV